MTPCCRFLKGKKQTAARRLALALGCLLCVLPVTAQRRHHDPLTGPEVEKIREAGIDPWLRIKLYTEFVNDHVNKLADLAKRTPSVQRDRKMDATLQDISSLMDELGSNLDQYGDRKADLRPGLKLLTKDSERWLTTLRGISKAPIFELSLEDATDVGKDISDQAAEMLKKQTEYFKLHKDQRWQERVEPKD